MRAPLVLLPGLLCDRALWAPQIAALADVAACEVADLTRSGSIAGMVADVLASAPPRFALAGLSMGGYVALALTAAAPERIERLALLDTTARPDSAARRDDRRAMIELARRGDFRGVTPRLFPRWVHPSRIGDRALIETVAEMARRVGREAFIRQQTALLDRPDGRPGLARIACPTLVLCGREDQVTPVADHQELAADIARSRLVIVEACGHLSTLEQPAAVSHALRAWLAEA